jgi:hypothetical protein
VDLMIGRLEQRLAEKDMGIELTPAARKLLATRGYDPAMGARPLRRTIQREIENQLSEKILFGEIHPGDIVVVDVDGEGDDARFTFTGTTKPRIPDALPARGLSGKTATDRRRGRKSRVPPPDAGCRVRRPSWPSGARSVPLSGGISM